MPLFSVTIRKHFFPVRVTGTGYPGLPRKVVVSPSLVCHPVLLALVALLEQRGGPGDFQSPFNFLLTLYLKPVGNYFPLAARVGRSYSSLSVSSAGWRSCTFLLLENWGETQICCQAGI